MSQRPKPTEACVGFEIVQGTVKKEWIVNEVTRDTCSCDNSSVGDELAMITSCLSIGPADVVSLEMVSTSAAHTPKHSGLYNTTLLDCQMATNSDADGTGGVPGFPDFPSCWTGQEGGGRLPSCKQRRNQNKGLTAKKARRCRKKLRMQANKKLLATLPCAGNKTGRQMKRTRQEHRRLKTVSTHNMALRRELRRDMGVIRQGMASFGVN